MAATPRTGSDGLSTHGGAGWRPRTAAHTAELGGIWAECGCTSEVDPLRAVLLLRPPDSMASAVDARANLMVGPVDLGLIRQQAEGVAAAYEEHGVRVHRVEPNAVASPNVVFARDLFFMTPGGAVVARMASAQRAGEEPVIARALSTLGVPIERTVTDTATFEGADALWLDRTTVVVGVGFRTNAAGARAVAGALCGYGVDVVKVRLGPGVQHLLGSVVFLDHGLAAVHGAAVGPGLRTLLRDRGYRLLEVPPDGELLTARGMNMVALAPGRVLMPTGAPVLRERMEAAGVSTHEVDVGEYVKAAGALGCLTGVLHRSAY
ncbi:arginine deiminase family protein [Umezawaea sp. Da 62-37]|uniref:dimethylarginine dimethylaminohydrolase family protein n=1 Tax=Umezawaea sp. Da 62-37 TaxID=3075927 RepID=UPI0028F6F648|nr:arginine deiminase family protein [Umezawaea sp. Da 62-37]WNV85000.1 arginine deiminase family protein [Umezawaea sp. Da 62-37]